MFHTCSEKYNACGQCRLLIVFHPPFEDDFQFKAGVYIVGWRPSRLFYELSLQTSSNCLKRNLSESTRICSEAEPGWAWRSRPPCPASRLHTRSRCLGNGLGRSPKRRKLDLETVNGLGGHRHMQTYNGNKTPSLACKSLVVEDSL